MGRKKRRTVHFFSNEFKHDAVSLVHDQGYSFAEASRAIDVHENTLRNWVMQLESNVPVRRPKVRRYSLNSSAFKRLKISLTA